ncbi:MAG: DUF1573 domain-containing protein [Pirellulales bacterium]
MMRKSFLALLVVVCACSLGMAQEWADKMFEVKSHDFGAIARGAKAEFYFTLENLYVEDIHIASVHSSCGCTSPRIEKDTLKTHEKGAIIASINSGSFLGAKSATVTVTIDKPYYAQVQLHVSSYIRSDVVMQPGAVEFGTVDLGARVEKKINVTYNGSGSWKIVDVRSANPNLEAEITERGRSMGQVSYDLVVRLKEGAPVGYMKDHLVLVTNDQRAGQVPVTVEGRIVSALTVSPASLFMGVLHPGQKVTKQLVVQSQSKKPFRIVGVKCDDANFQFKTPDTSKALHLIPVTFVAGDKAGKIAQKIRIETDLGVDVVPEFSAYAQVVTP